MQIKTILFFIFCFQFLVRANDYSPLQNDNINIENGVEAPINIWNINSVEDDFAPYFMQYKNCLIFNSIVNGYSKYFTTIVEYKSDSNITFISPVIFNSALNQNNKNVAYFCLLDAHQALVNAYSQLKKGNFINIQRTMFERNSWTAPSNIAELADACFIGHPTISLNKNVLIFTSNKNSTDNTTDLWSATLQPDGIWDMLIPIDELNSIGNEITPYFINDTTLIFASDGFDGKGGYDLFYSYYINGTWTKPLPLEDINTEYNESDPTILFNNLIFASDRPGGKGKLDLYYATIKSNNNIEEKINTLSISATNYQLNITRNIEYDLTSNTARKITNIIDDTSYILVPNVIEFSIQRDSVTKNNIHYKLYCEDDTLVNNTISGVDSSVIIRFTNYAPKIFMFDSCYFQVLSFQTSPAIIPLEIIKDENKSLKIYSQNNNIFYKVITMYANNIKDFEDNNRDIIFNLKELAAYSKHIDIITNSKQTYQELSKMFNAKQVINFIETNNSDVIEFRLHR
jgi:hypothetical protein